MGLFQILPRVLKTIDTGDLKGWVWDSSCMVVGINIISWESEVSFQLESQCFSFGQVDIMLRAMWL